MAMKDISVVLAHGGWADGTSWTRVITGLAAHGIKSVAAPLPLTELADDVAALNRSIERMPGPVVLAAHAYAGAVMGLARPERVKALVYVTPDATAKSGTARIRMGLLKSPSIRVARTATSVSRLAYQNAVPIGRSLNVPAR